MLGRVTSAFRLVSFGAVVIGSAFAGTVASLAGVRAVLATTAILNLVVLAPFFLVVTDHALATAMQRQDGALPTSPGPRADPA